MTTPPFSFLLTSPHNFPLLLRRTNRLVQGLNEYTHSFIIVSGDQSPYTNYSCIVSHGSGAVLLKAFATWGARGDLTMSCPRPSRTESQFSCNVLAWVTLQCLLVAFKIQTFDTSFPQSSWLGESPHMKSFSRMFHFTLFTNSLRYRLLPLSDGNAVSHTHAFHGPLRPFCCTSENDEIVAVLLPSRW